jgi:nitrate/TMAO reductase-like tetraheme cytochrome c subunit
VLGVLFGVNSYISTPSFCSTCHELAPEYITYQASDHNQIKCVQCHSKPGAKNSVLYQVNLLKEVYSHLTGSPKQIVLTTPVPSENCEQCHSKNRLVTATGDLKVNHKGHIERGIPCTTCHRGVAHAKIVERGINNSNTYADWTEKNANKLIEEKFVKPNMGTCIDCHEQVNQGKQPWKNTAYSLPKTNTGKKQKEASATFGDTPEMKAGILARELPKNKQKTILEAIGKQQTDVKISMECFTCHQQIKVPKNHEIQNWSQRGHGQFAVKDLGKCLTCHQDSLWIKELDKQDITTLLTDNKKKVTYKQDLIIARNVSRSNFFCRTCHENIPSSHQDRYTWLTDTHRQYSGTPEERKVCFVCHDNQKPIGKNGNAPSDVYCDFCHQGKFPGEPS